MNEEFRKHMKQNFNLQETEDLLKIWAFQNHATWTDTALEVVEEIILERLGELPNRKELLEEYTPDAITNLREKLGRVFNFIDEDLVENQQGRLSGKQVRSTFFDWFGVQIFMIPIGLVGVLGGLGMLMQPVYELITNQDNLYEDWIGFYQFLLELGYQVIFFIILVIFIVGFLCFLIYFGWIILMLSAQRAIEIFRRQVEYNDGRLTLVTFKDEEETSYYFRIADKNFSFGKEDALNLNNTRYRIYLLPITKKTVSVKVF
jgi:hypothetical protein